MLLPQTHGKAHLPSKDTPLLPPKTQIPQSKHKPTTSATKNTNDPPKTQTHLAIRQPLQPRNAAESNDYLKPTIPTDHQRLFLANPFLLPPKCKPTNNRNQRLFFDQTPSPSFKLRPISVPTFRPFKTPISLLQNAPQPSPSKPAH